ncbi:MAG: lipid-A-disaccharide synthase [Saprospiraceae bacterium]|nr:lipid-A-disaccharide synthase [Saprospiraceae bacterium]
MKYYLLAGEASGDLHGANLVKALKKLDPSTNIRAWGGDKMKSEGCHIVTHYRDMAFMGFVEVLKNIPTIWKYFRKCKEDILNFKPDVLILIDYPGFNLRMAKWAKNQGIKVVYYITPQVWAWHQSRVHALDNYTDLLLVILPFEKDFFAKFGYESIFTGHPLLDAVKEYKPKNILQEGASKPILALLPGSRKQEVKTMLPIFLKAIDRMPYEIIIGAAGSLDDSIYQEIIESYPTDSKIRIVKDQTYNLLSVAELAIVSSGTATLETALFDVPQIVCYKGNKLSYVIARRLVDIKYISLVNLVSNKEVVTELIQNELTPENIRKEIQKIENGKDVQIKNDYKLLRKLLGEAGASERAAIEISTLLKKDKN